MNPQVFVSELQRKGISLWVDGDGSLRYRAPAGTLSDELRSQIRSQRTELIDWLSSVIVPTENVPDADDPGADLPFTPNQIWYLETVQPQDVDWSNIVSWQFRKPVSPQLLKRVLFVLVSRHDLFRLRRYRQQDGRWAQHLIAQPDPLPLEVIDLQQESAAVDQREVLLQLGRRCQSRLSCLHGPILAMGVILSKDRSKDQAVISVHHFDGFSISLFLSEMMQAYSQLERLEPIHLPPTSRDYADYLRLLSERCQQPDFLSRQRDFWLSQQQLSPVPSIPRDAHGGEHFAANSRQYELQFPLELRARIADFVMAHEGISFLDLVLFGLCRGYAQWSLGQPLYLDMEHHGRSGILDEIDLARTLGPTTVKVPVRLPAVLPSADLDALEIIRTVHRTTMKHAIGYGYLRYCRPDRHLADRLSAQPAPEVLLNNRSTLPATVLESIVNLGGEPEWLPNPEQNKVTYTLIIECERGPDSLSLVFRYSSMIHREETIKRFASGVLDSIKRIMPGDS